MSAAWIIESWIERDTQIQQIFARVLVSGLPSCAAQQAVYDPQRTLSLIGIAWVVSQVGYQSSI